MLAEPRRFERRLNIHLEISKVGYELRVRLGLVPSAHDSKGHARIALPGKRGNNRVERPLSSCQGVGRSRVKRKKSASVMQGEPCSRSHNSRTKRLVIALDQRHHVSFAVYDAQVSRVISGGDFS